jgi:uncharacterized Ntn-hydrolase superfamily protein
MPEPPESAPRHKPGNGTFSIVAMDPETREWGVAVASRILDCGYVVIWLKAEVGAVATQGQVNARLGPLALELLAAGRTAAEALSEAMAMDPGGAVRQLGIVDRLGNSAAHTGSDTLHWGGHLTAESVSVQGNVIVGPQVVSAMLDAFRYTPGELAERLLSALEAGEREGGDKRGRQSAALVVSRKHGGYDGTDDRLVDIRVPDHPEPVKELRRLYEMWRYAFLAPAYLRLADEDHNCANTFRQRTRDLIVKALYDRLDKAEIYNNLAWHLAMRREYPAEAILIAKRAHDLAPEDPNIMDTLAEAYFVAGERRQAVYYEEEALKREPGNEFFRQQLARFAKDVETA